MMSMEEIIRFFAKLYSYDATDDPSRALFEKIVQSQENAIPHDLHLGVVETSQISLETMNIEEAYVHAISAFNSVRGSIYPPDK